MKTTIKEVESFNLMKELEDGLKIDKHNLDEHVEQHSSLAYRVGKLYARAISDSESIKVTLDRTEAEVYENLRAEAQALKDGPRITEASLKNQVELSSEIIDLKQQYLKAKAHALELGALKEAYTTRGYKLRDEIDLFMYNYFTVETGKDRSNAIEKSADKNRKEAGRLREQRQAR